MSAFLACAATVFIVTAPAVPAAVVKSYEINRASSYDMEGTELATTRGYITDPASFGPGGTVSQAYQVGTGIEVASAATLAGTDVFFTGWVGTDTYTEAEKTALYNFVLGGGTLIATTDDTAHTMVDAFGLTQGDGGGVPPNQITDLDHPIADGPFGTVATYEQFFLTGHYPTIGSAHEIGENVNGTTIAVIERGELGPGSGAAIFVADVDVFSSSGGAEVNETLIKNIFAFALPVSTTYPRPQAANTYRAALVPAFTQCTAPNSTHAAPIDRPSCSPPQPMSDELTMGTPDFNGQPARFAGTVKLAVKPGNLATPVDEADNAVTVSISDVRRQQNLADYTGELRFRTSLRITDKQNGTAGTAGGTVQDFAFAFVIPCTATASTTVGSNCNLTTSLDTLTPGMVREGKRTVTHMSDILVYDGGADSDGDTQGDNTLFAWEGIFTP
jgi:hypothetical protein